mmetsp:Transcript_1696/g.3537  ORF Transcript_1696/g.3537 Transcript_1696/m.3537 type:complete len:211 (+) Transcript_1696:437-1069(+)
MSLSPGTSRRAARREGFDLFFFGSGMSLSYALSKRLTGMPISAFDAVSLQPVMSRISIAECDRRPGSPIIPPPNASLSSSIPMLIPVPACAFCWYGRSTFAADRLPPPTAGREEVGFMPIADWERRMGRRRSFVGLRSSCSATFSSRLRCSHAFSLRLSSVSSLDKKSFESHATMMGRSISFFPSLPSSLASRCRILFSYASRRKSSCLE